MGLQRKVTALPSHMRIVSIKERVEVLACVMLLHELGKVPVILFMPTSRNSSCNTATQLIVVQTDLPEVYARSRLYK